MRNHRSSAERRAERATTPQFEGVRVDGGNQCGATLGHTNAGRPLPPRASVSAETEARREAAMPPFGRLAAIIVSSEDSAEAAETARRIGRAAPTVPDMAVYGPAPAPLAMLRGRHRQRLLVHAPRALDVQDVIRDWLGGIEVPKGARVSVDVDPYSFL